VCGGVHTKKPPTKHALLSLSLSLEPSLSIKKNTGDVSELGLAFTVSYEASSGGGGGGSSTARDVELVPGGAARAVTSDNVLEYVHRAADWYLNARMARPCAAFLSGFFDVLRREWVAPFNAPELQALLGGAPDARGGFDVDDLAAHAELAGVCCLVCFVLLWFVLLVC
jgi:hypothetical protein